MRLLITGKNGAIGKKLLYLFSQCMEYDTSSMSRAYCDLSDVECVNKLPKADVLINCASSICREGQAQNENVLYNNLLINENILLNSHKYKKIIMIGSGAEYDQSKDIRAPYDKISRIPKDYYGLSKLISRERCLTYDNIYWLRCYMVFGDTEANDRFFKQNILKAIKDEPILIPKNRMVSCFSMLDLFKVINQVIKRNSKTKQIDMSYGVHSLLSLAEKIKEISGSNSEILVKDKVNFAKDYYSTYETGADFDIFGLTFSLNQLYLKLS